MPTPTRCELPAHVLSQMNRREAKAYVKVADEAHGIYFQPMLRYVQDNGEVRHEALAETCDLPDFSKDGSRQCFVWGYSELEDALAVVREANRARS